MYFFSPSSPHGSLKTCGSLLFALITAHKFLPRLRAWLSRISIPLPTWTFSVQRFWHSLWVFQRSLALSSFEINSSSCVIALDAILLAVWSQLLRRRHHGVRSLQTNCTFVSVIQGFSAMSPSFWWRAVLFIVVCSSASLPFTKQTPVASSQLWQTYFQTLSDIPWIWLLVMNHCYNPIYCDMKALNKLCCNKYRVRRY